MFSVCGVPPLLSDSITSVAASAPGDVGVNVTVIGDALEAPAPMASLGFWPLMLKSLLPVTVMLLMFNGPDPLRLSSVTMTFGDCPRLTLPKLCDVGVLSITPVVPVPSILIVEVLAGIPPAS
jgi:hypothetical protein